MKPTLAKLSILLGAVCSVCFLALTTVQAAHVDEMMWSVEFKEMLTINKAAYPDSDFRPYFQKASKLGAASASGDDKAVKTQLEEVDKMLDKGDINEDAAADLKNFVHYWKAAVTPKTKFVRGK